MATPIIARQLGDEYQQLVFWKYALMMLSGKYEIENIRYEDDTVKSYDDIVIQYSKPQKSTCQYTRAFVSFKRLPLRCW